MLIIRNLNLISGQSWTYLYKSGYAATQLVHSLSILEREIDTLHWYVAT